MGASVPGGAARARQDGYTIDIGFLGNHVLNGAFYSLPYDLLNAFAPISPLVTLPLVLYARKTMPANDLNELIAWLKANPNKGTAGVSSVGARPMTAFFQKETGTHFTLVPYRGAAPAAQDLMAGQIDLLVSGPNELPLMRAGNSNAYAVSSDMRMAVAPDIPTFAEMGRVPGTMERPLPLFNQGLAETGYVVGRNVTIDASGDHVGQQAAIAADLVRRHVAVIVAVGIRAARAAKAARPSRLFS
jgi:tripartite-type tricarboxylate transporter receptor subunit TctC